MRLPSWSRASGALAASHLDLLPLGEADVSLLPVRPAAERAPEALLLAGLVHHAHRVHLHLEEELDGGADLRLGRVATHPEHVLVALGEQPRPLSALLGDYERYAASGEINFRVEDASACVESVVSSFASQAISLDHLDGVTVDLGDGAWFNLRTSNTEPLLRLNVEARSAGAVDAIVSQAAERIADPKRVGAGGAGP